MRLPRLVRSPSRFPPSSHRSGGARVAARLLTASLLIVLGCAHPAATSPPPAMAKLRIRNLGDHEWSVALDAVSGRPVPGSPWDISPRGERTVLVPAGEYRLRQTLVGTAPPANDGPDRNRAPQNVTRLLGGRAYTWPLATLLSQPEEPAP